jgi:hypothetical protein
MRLPSAPVAGRVEDMPSVFHTIYLDAIDEAIAVNSLKKITRNVSDTYFNISEITSTETSEDVELIDSCKRMKYAKDSESSDLGSKRCEIVKNKLKVVCASYDEANMILRER